MTVVSVSELKAHLSRYLRAVRRGSEVQIVDRGRPVARLVGVTEAGGESGEDPRRRLVADGIVRAGNGAILEILDEPPLNLSVSIAAALDEERADRL
jgi:prevent-host-death family protein